ncbi:MAG: excinuclease ABC subunit UvrC [Sulfurospirillum sp.]
MSLIEDLRNLPQSSGVYQYFDEQERLLYIGKAKNLKNRVKSYFRFTPSLSPSTNLSMRIHKMVSEAKSIRYILVENEQDALILENSLIKQLKPKYNILLRDDKTYPYIAINPEEDFPRFEIVRKIIKKKGMKYFGPFTSSSKDIIDSLYLLFNLVQKKNCLKSKKACLFHQMNRCHAPCVGKINKTEYQKIVTNAILALKDKKIMIEMLGSKMNKAVELENFEEAAKIRDKMKAIKNTLHVSDIDFAKLENLDLFCIQTTQSKAIIMRLFMREGKIISTSHNILKNQQDFEKDEFYKRALLQFYSNNSPQLCNQIIVGDDFASKNDIERYLCSTFKKKIKITHPKIGDKANLIRISQKNAKYLLSIEVEKEDIHPILQSLFELKHAPYRIEVFDNSHLGGTATVGAMVVWDGKWEKKSYRKYNLHSKDEYSQMQELLSRRIESFTTESKPDLWLIDGGSTLLKLAKKLLVKYKIDLDVLAISKEKLDFKSVRSKGRAKDIIHSSSRSYTLPTNDRRLQFLQKLRDEAHRFAITFHQKKKRKIDLSNKLTTIDGIGNATVKKLLSYFGSFDAIYKAGIEELETVLNSKLAKKIYDFIQ